MKDKKIWLLLALSLMMLFAVLPQAFANDGSQVTASDIITLVEGFDDEGQFANGSAVRALTMHLTAVNHFEQRGETDKVVEHMNSFKQLLDHQLNQELISESAYGMLMENTDALIQSYDPTEPETVSIVHEGQANAVIVVSEQSGKPLGNIAGWTRYGTKGNEIIYPSSEKRYSGFYSLNINHEDGGSYYSTLSHGIRVSEGDIFNASAKVYIEERGDGTRDYPYFSISFYDDRGNNIQNNEGTWTADESKDGWFEGSAITGVMPDNAYTVRVLVRAMPNGSFYLDDLELTREGHEENLLANPGFEINPIANSAANTLIEYIQKASGVQLPVITSEPADMDEVAIFVGLSASEDEARHQALLSGLNEHGYIIDVQDERITIVGNTPVATDYGVAEFLEEYLGVRWLMPGPDGEHVPQQSTIAVPKELVEDEPAAISRHFFSGGNPAYTAWYNNNRMIHNIQFHHNMNNLFSPAVFADRPELYAGDVVPTDASSWQPKFNEETADVAIQRIIEFFDTNPQETSYSLGINDGAKYHEVPGNEYFGVVFTGERNSTGNTHRTDYYARWMNIVAEGVAEEYPDKYLGFLAYREMQDPPKNPDGSTYQLHPNLVPYITVDRMMWANPAFKQEGQTHVEAWHESAENIGWYDCMYGAAYSLPRIYFHLMDENYTFAKDQGIIGHVAELYPNFAGEGPKAWLASKLQWDPDQDVDVLLEDWYVSAVGEEAAPYLREYYEFWEEFWTERILDSNWFPSLPRVYLDFNNLTYLRELTREELYAQRDLLLQVLDHAETDAQKVRAQYFLEGYEYYEASFLSYPLANDVEVEIPLNEADALEILDRAIESYEMAQRRLEIPDEFFSDPILRHYGSNRGFWDGIQPKYIEALETYVAENEPDGGVVTDQFNQFLQDIGYIAIEANAYRTEASKEDIMASLDFSQGPWENAVAVDQFYIINSKVEPPVETKVRLLWDDEYIYVGYENFDDDLSGLISGELAESGFWWASGQDDSNETYITAHPDEAFLGFFSNPEGNKFVRPRTIPADYVEPVWDYSASIGDDRWAAIQAIPFDLIGVDDPYETSSIHAIFFRSYHGASAYIGWEGGAPWNPAGFNTVNLVQ